MTITQAPISRPPGEVIDAIVSDPVADGWRETTRTDVATPGACSTMSSTGAADRLLWRLCDHRREEHRTGGRREHVHLGHDDTILASPELTWEVLLEALEAASELRVPNWGP